MEERFSRNTFLFYLQAIVASFLTYSCMYAIRKPITAATFDGLLFAGINYKVALIIFQVIGYTLSKFMGIKFVSEVPYHKRKLTLSLTVGLGWGSLLLFALIPAPYNAPILIFNGLCLGMVWGLVFSYLEGRTTTEFLGACLCTTFILSSGIVKAVGKYLIHLGITEFWMPFTTGAIFALPFIFSIYLLDKLPSPSEEDKKFRSERIPMSPEDRKKFFSEFTLGIILVLIAYGLLSTVRDVRDNFAPEILEGLGLGQKPALLVMTEIPIFILCLIVIASSSFIKNNSKGLWFNFWLYLFSGVTIVISTFLYQNNQMEPIYWLIILGLATYLPYISLQINLVDRWVALFKMKGTVSPLVCLMDGFGYFISTLVMLYKAFGETKVTWPSFLAQLTWILGISLIALSGLTYFYFQSKLKTELVAEPLPA
tara:strand:+ start:1738 stop:3015 length:1278 start_codon:yes stop_codon:yes gene_type:complete